MKDLLADLRTFAVHGFRGGNVAGPKKPSAGGKKKDAAMPLLLRAAKPTKDARDDQPTPFSISEESVEFMMSSAALAYDLELLDEALRIYNGVACARPKWSRPKIGQGAVLYKKGDLAGAESAYRGALEIDPKDQEATLYLGELLYQGLGKVDEARGVLVKALELNPMNDFGGRAQVVLIEMMRSLAESMSSEKEGR